MSSNVTLAAAAAATTDQDQDDDVLCDIENPILFQAVLTRLRAMLRRTQWAGIATKLARLSPRSAIVAVAAGDVHTAFNCEPWLHWMIHDPDPYIEAYIDRHPIAMIREVRELVFRPLHHPCSLYRFTSLRTLCFSSCYENNPPDHFYSQLRHYMTGLQNLDMEITYLSSHELLEVTQMTSLEQLGIDVEMPFDLDVIPPLGALHRLERLDLLYGGIEYPPLVNCDTLRGLTRLEQMQLSMSLSDDAAASLPELLPSLRSLKNDRPTISKSAMKLLHSHFMSYLRGDKGFEFISEWVEEYDDEEEEGDEVQEWVDEENEEEEEEGDEIVHDEGESKSSEDEAS